MKKLYITLTYTGTLLAKCIKLYTRKEYSHVSIAFDEELKEMYSFGRLYTYIAFIGGFVRESLTSGTYKRFKNTEAAVYELEVTEEQYNKCREFVRNLYAEKDKYKFNFIGVFFVMFNKQIKRQYAMYCAEFVKASLEAGKIDTSYLPKVIKPEDFKELKNANLVYTGQLKKYRAKLKEKRRKEKQQMQIPVIPILSKKAAV